MTATDRYIKAHQYWFSHQYPTATRDGHYVLPKFPNTAKANGLTQAIINYLTWSGHRATRINTMGRPVESSEATVDGKKIRTRKYLPSTTKRGTADISATIKGRSVMIEVKVGRDKPREEQLKEQMRERAAGGTYEFIGTFDEFLNLYDILTNEGI